MARTSLTLEPTGHDATAAIQAALDTALSGPLHLVLAPGRHVSAGLRLYSDTVLELAAGATLTFVPNYDAYAHTEVAVEAERSTRAMIVALRAEGLRIVGAGRIVCDGAMAFSDGEDTAMGTRIPKAHRPRVMVLDGCKDIEISGIEVVDSPMWTLHFVDCEGVRVANIRIDNDRRMPNTDGVVIDGCTDIEITGCEIRTADDGVVLKTSARLEGSAVAPCTGVTVRNCVIESRSCALKIGTESHADFTDITFAACRIEGSNRALGIFSRDGGAVQGVLFEDITLDCHEFPGGYWGSGEPVTINALDRRPGKRPAGIIEGIVIRRMTGTAPGAINLVAERPGLIRDIRLEDIDMTQTPGPLGTALQYDLRPTPADLLPVDEGASGRPNAWRMTQDGRIVGLCDYPSGLPAVYASGISDLILNRVAVARPTPLPKGWSFEPVIEDQHA